MKPCILYFSATGNTKKFAQTISTSLNLPIFNIEDIKPQIVLDYDIILIGTPIHGMAPAKVITSFVEKLPRMDNKKTIIFSTYAIRQGNAIEKLQTQLAEKGYATILNTSKRGVRFGDEAFENNIEQIKKIILQSSSDT